ncbi:MAG TPA: CDP-archaeol synthase [Terriglobales bacterium]|nr:CDP-archaeol synthase [Terriglobales bacterium]
MSASQLNPGACTAFLLAAFTLAGLCQTAWLASPASQQFFVPLDGGRTFRGRRLFGANKTVRGFLMIVPAAGASFALLAAFFASSPAGLAGLWPLSLRDYALLGLWAGAGFMVGELPNSFIKRQLDIAPGAAAHGRSLRILFSVVDRIDWIAGMLLALCLIVPVPGRVWMYVAVIGPVVHWCFSVALFQLGVKGRAA